ncbi:MAG: hypothetical protein RLZZ15_518 [Verrucomicrobiota bacterium]|jgi:rod shape-determining protein MreC
MSLFRALTTKPFAALGVVALGWLLVPVLVKTFLRASFFELTAPVAVTADYARVLQDYWSLRLHTNDELVAAGRDLTRLNSAYEVAYQQNATLRAEIARLEKLLRVPALAEFRAEHARVVRRDFSGWWQRLVIRKGRNYGLTVDAPVIFAGGVVGKVTEVHATTAVVELLSSPNVRLAAVAEGDELGRPITFQGGVNPTFGPARGVVEFVPLDIFASGAAPKRLVTSSLGGVFPAGLAIGEIVKLDLAPDGLFKSGEVRLDDRLDSLVEVTVLVPRG